MRPLSFYEELEVQRDHSIEKTSEIPDANSLVEERETYLDRHPSLLFHSVNEMVSSLSVFPAVSNHEENNNEPSEAPEKGNVGYNWKIISNPACIIIGIIGFFFECGLAVILSCLPLLGKENSRWKIDVRDFTA